MDDGHFDGGRAAHGCNFIRVMTNECVVCRQPAERNLIVLGQPYHAVVHMQCWPAFKFDGRYPHPLPMSEYDRLSPPAKKFLALTRSNE